MPNTDPPSPPLSQTQSHSTCPEDTNSSAPWSSPPPPWRPDSAEPGPDDQGTEHHHHHHLAEHLSPGAVSAPLSGSVTVAESIVGDDAPSGATSRSATMSPGPPSVAAASSFSPSPVSGNGRGAVDSLKQTEAEGTLAREALARDSRLRSANTTSRRQTFRDGQPSMMTDSERSVDFGMADWDWDWEDEPSATSMGPDYSNMRVIATSPSSFLRPGSRFHGTQQSERQVYEVQVEIKHVDLRESFLCGYLRIQGLTEDHPTLTTYFEGEIIGNKYHFITNHESWGANEKIDLSHWAKFNAFRPYHRPAKKGPVLIRDAAQRENIFMRWKEHFLVPDHRVRTISGASFEGFYYICFNQIKGEVSGIYFHAKSEKFQQLELKHVEDRGCFGAMEFR